MPVVVLKCKMLKAITVPKIWKKAFHKAHCGCKIQTVPAPCFHHSVHCPTNPWFDLECKDFHHHLRRSIVCDPRSAFIVVLHRSYRRLLKTKKCHFLTKRRTDIISSLHAYPKSFWCSFLPKNYLTNSISLHALKEYASRLYTFGGHPTLTPIRRPLTSNFFSSPLIHSAIQILNLGKAIDIEDLQAELFKNNIHILPPSSCSSLTMLFALVFLLPRLPTLFTPSLRPMMTQAIIAPS